MLVPLSFSSSGWSSLLQCVATTSREAFIQHIAQPSFVPLLEAIQSNSFLLHAVGSWDLDNGAIACLPLKVFGWNCLKQEFSLQLFNGLLNESPSYAELSLDGKQVALYQYQQEANIYYSYKAIARSTTLLPTRYLIQAFACTDRQHWDLIVEGEYRIA